MTNLPPDSIVRHNNESDADFIKKIVAHNESLFIEVEQLRLLAQKHSAAEPQRLRDENATLRQRLQMAEMRLAEADAQKKTNAFVGGGASPWALAENKNPPQRQTESLRREAFERDAMLRRVQSLLSSGNIDIKGIKMLFEEILDYQQSSDEEKNNAILINEMKHEDMKKEYERRIKNLRSENESLRSAFEIYKQQNLDAAAAGQTPRVRTSAVEQTPQSARGSSNDVVDLWSPNAFATAGK